MSGHVYFVENIGGEESLTQITHLVLQETQSKHDLKNLAFTHVTSVSELILALYRKHRLSKNERETVLSYEAQMVAMQLCLAEVNKQEIGDFDIEVSKVIDLKKHYIAQCLEKLSSIQNDEDIVNDTVQSDNSSQDKSELGCACLKYQEMLKQINAVDFFHVLYNVLVEKLSNEELKKDFGNLSFAVTVQPANQIEKAILQQLCQNKACHLVHIEMPLTVDNDNNQSLDGATVRVHDLLQEELENSVQNCHSVLQSNRSATENFVQSIVMSYIELLVNSRNELALARVINIPERGLDHKAFTSLKHESKMRKMSLYQTAVSYVMKVRLGGKGYRPDANCGLAPYIKGLSELTDLMHRLSDAIEEDINSRSATRRVVNIIKNVLHRTKDGKLRQSSIETVTQEIQKQLSDLVDKAETLKTDSPPKSAGKGGTALGRGSIKVLRMLLDQANSQVSGMNSVEILDDVYSSQKTPIRFPSIMSQFRSPIMVLEDSASPVKERLAERLQKRKMTEKSNEGKGIRYESCLDWCDESSQNAEDVKFFKQAQHQHITTSNLSNAGSIDGAPEKETSRDKSEISDGKTERNVTTKEVSKQVVSEPIKSGKNKKISESVNDQENQSAVQALKKNRGNKRPLSIITNGNNAGKQSKKPKLSSNPASKKSCKRKLIAQIEGQKKLTSFFRV